MSVQESTAESFHLGCLVDGALPETFLAFEVMSALKHRPNSGSFESVAGQLDELDELESDELGERESDEKVEFEFLYWLSTQTARQEQFFEAFVSSLERLAQRAIMDREFGLVHSTARMKKASLFGYLGALFALIPASIGLEFEIGTLWRIACDNSRRLAYLRRLLGGQSGIQYKKAEDALAMLDSAKTSTSSFFTVLEAWRNSNESKPLDLSEQSCELPNYLAYEKRVRCYALQVALEIVDAVELTAQFYAHSKQTGQASLSLDHYLSARAQLVDSFIDQTLDQFRRD